MCNYFMHGTANELYEMYNSIKPLIASAPTIMVGSGNGIRFNKQLCNKFREMFDKDTALDVFDYDVYGQDAINLGKKEPTTVFKSNSIHEESLITYDDTPCFAVTRYTIKNAQLELKHSPAVYVVTNGTGHVNGHIRLKKGDNFFLPYSAEKTSVETQSPEGLEIIACLPPKK